MTVHTGTEIGRSDNLRLFLGNVGLAVCSLVVGTSLSSSGQGIEDATYEIAVEGEGNEIVANSRPYDVQFEMISQQGIGSAKIAVIGGDFPEKMELLIHLQGLEELKLGYDSTEVTVQCQALITKSTIM